MSKKVVRWVTLAWLCVAVACGCSGRKRSKQQSRKATASQKAAPRAKTGPARPDPDKGTVTPWLHQVQALRYLPADVYSVTAFASPKALTAALGLPQLASHQPKRYAHLRGELADLLGVDLLGAGGVARLGVATDQPAGYVWFPWGARGVFVTVADERRLVDTFRQLGAPSGDPPQRQSVGSGAVYEVSGASQRLVIRGKVALLLWGPYTKEVILLAERIAGLTQAKGLAAKPTFLKAAQGLRFGRLGQSWVGLGAMRAGFSARLAKDIKKAQAQLAKAKGAQRRSVESRLKALQTRRQELERKWGPLSGLIWGFDVTTQKLRGRGWLLSEKPLSPERAAALFKGSTLPLAGLTRLVKAGPEPGQLALHLLGAALVPGHRAVDGLFSSASACVTLFGSGFPAPSPVVTKLNKRRCALVAKRNDLLRAERKRVNLFLSKARDRLGPTRVELRAHSGGLELRGEQSLGTGGLPAFVQQLAKTWPATGARGPSARPLAALRQQISKVTKQWKRARDRHNQEQGVRLLTTPGLSRRPPVGTGLPVGPSRGFGIGGSGAGSTGGPRPSGGALGAGRRRGLRYGAGVRRPKPRP